MKTKFLAQTKASRIKFYSLEKAKQFAEAQTRSTGNSCEIYSLIAVCHPPDPQPCRWEELTTKKSDRDYDLVPLPEGVAPPPDGFAYFGHADYASTASEGWESKDTRFLNTNGQWEEGLPLLIKQISLRIGSKIAKQNGIGVGE